MNISKVSNSNQQFNGWSNLAKKDLVSIIRRLPKENAQKAINLVNNLESSSPHHNLGANQFGFWSIEKNGFTKTKDFNLAIDPMFLIWKNPIAVLKEMQEHINNENKLIGKIGQSISKIMPKLKQYREIKPIAEGGLVLDKKAQKLFSIKLAQMAQENNGELKVAQALNKLNTINTKAKNLNLTVTTNRYTGNVAVYGILRNPYEQFGKNVKINDDFTKTLNKVEKVLDKESHRRTKFIEMEKLETAKLNLSFAKENLQITKAELKKEQIKYREKRFKEIAENSTVIKFIKNIFTKLEKNSLAKDKKIQKELKF